MMTLGKIYEINEKMERRKPTVSKLLKLEIN